MSTPNGNSSAVTSSGEDVARKPRPVRNNTMRSSYLTRTRGFTKLTHWAFSVCDNNHTGTVNQDELYAGILLVHVNLAKYAGAAACYPPSRQVVTSLFRAADANHSGRINEAEFVQIMRACSVDILSRMAVYYSILILLVPYLAGALVQGFLNLDDWLGWHVKTTESTIFTYIEAILSWNELAEKMVGSALLILIVPLFFEWIDQRSTNNAKSISQRDGISDDSDDGDKKKSE